MAKADASSGNDVKRASQVNSYWLSGVFGWTNELSVAGGSHWVPPPIN